MGCSWSEAVPDPSSTPQPIVAGSPPRTTTSSNWAPRAYYDPREESSEEEEEEVVGYEQETGRRDGHGSEEDFFAGFFSVLDRVPGYHGTLQRWKNDVKWAAEEDSHILRWEYVWRQDDMGYLKTLKRVSQLVQEEESFTTSDLVCLLALAKKVAKHRKREYYRAQRSGRANTRHQKAVRGWTEIVDKLEAVTC